MNNKEIVKTWFAHIDANNFEGIKELMASNHQFHNPMTPAPVGKDEHIGMMQMMTSSFKGAHSLKQVIQDGEWAAAYGTYTGTHSGEFNGVAPTGKEVTFSWLDMFHIINGKVEEEYFEMNPMSIMAQIGA
jgi:predicted ester cyclase